MLHHYKIGLLGCLMFAALNTLGQGCVAIRSGCGMNTGGSLLLSRGQWQTGSNFRYFHSYKHFRGTHEERYRVAEGSEVINDSYFLDLQWSYAITNRLTANLTIPFVYHNRSSMYEHGGNPSNDLPSSVENEYWPGDRHITSSKGLGDIRLGFGYWILDPINTANLSVGLGMKLPSGDFRARDTFYNQGEDRDESIRSGIDQSIQPGDGGFGVTVELQGFLPISNNITLSGNIYYLINPRGYYTLEARNRIREYSVADQFAARLGVLTMLPIHGLYLYGGGRLEGVPSTDLIGSNAGFRRPGYVVSLEPGLNYAIRNLVIILTLPVAIERNRTKSFPDKISGRHGDAAFADYLINVGFSYRLNRSRSLIDFSEKN